MEVMAWHATHFFDNNCNVFQLFPDAVFQLLDVDALRSLGIVDIFWPNALQLPLRILKYIV